MKNCSMYRVKTEIRSPVISLRSLKTEGYHDANFTSLASQTDVVNTTSVTTCDDKVGIMSIFSQTSLGLTHAYTHTRTNTETDRCRWRQYLHEGPNWPRVENLNILFDKNAMPASQHLSTPCLSFTQTTVLTSHTKISIFPRARAAKCGVRNVVSR